ncbi:MAG: ATP-binding cassette domain-containing protein [Firmicutes bacterium]|jgi:Fe-S cluster assembly ATP-binding protein|nr:ATP-binding cassette domain-containing protein [Bacillota bacterium]
MLQIKDLSFVAEDGRTILNNINLEVPTGKLVVLTGPNGGGKTTLAKMISGVARPTSGQILLDGEDITALDPTERAKRGVSYAFQQPVRFKGISVRDLLNLANGSPMSDEEVKATLERVGLVAGAYIDRDVDTHLSGGEIKRIEIASVILRKAKLALFDEPEAGIDLWSFNNLIRVFEMMREAGDCSIMIISHQERILSIADEIVMIQNGRVGLHGGRDKMFPNLLCGGRNCDECGVNGEAK